MASAPIIIGTRGSKLALRQAQITLDALTAAHPDAEFDLKTIRTSGDNTEAPLSEVGGRGIFVIEIERALLKNEIDIAVHSLKDLPSEETPNLSIRAVLPREDPRDVLITRTGGDLASLSSGATIGTGSPRRASALRALRSDIEIADIRGNVDTRLRKVQDGDYDATVLAAAGLARLGWLDQVAQTFGVDEMVPAVGQGALAIQTRAEDDETGSLLAALDDPGTRAAVTAERAFERRLGGGCHAAIAAHGTVDGGALHLRAFVGSDNGTILRGETNGSHSDAEALGVALGEQLLAQGAAELLEAAR